MEDYNIFYTIFDEIPMAIIIVDDDVKAQFINKEGKKLIDNETEIYQKKGGEILKCVHSKEHTLGCGHSSFCKSCIIRNSVNEAVTGKKTYRKQTVLRLRTKEKEILYHALITTTPFSFENKSFYMLMIENVNELMQLKDIIPICCNCKKVRDDENFWVAVEQYFNKQTDIDFSHSICPECTDLLYPELKEIRARKKYKTDNS